MENNKLSDALNNYFKRALCIPQNMSRRLYTIGEASEALEINSNKFENMFEQFCTDRELLCDWQIVCADNEEDVAVITINSIAWFCIEYPDESHITQLFSSIYSHI